MNRTYTMSRTYAWSFYFLFVLSLVFGWNALAATFKLALGNEAYTHILLIVPLSVALIYFDTSNAGRMLADSRPTVAMGVAFLILSLGAMIVGRWARIGAPGDVRLSLGMLSLVLWWIGSVIACFGVRVFKSFFFPFCFLLLLVPLPLAVVNWIVDFLQVQSAIAARLMFQLVRVPVTQDGIVLSIPGLDIEVATECSSIRSSMILLVMTMVFAHLFLRSPWRKLLLIVAVIPLSVAKNALRIVTIAELGTRVDPGFLTGKLHHNGGIVFLDLAVAAMAALLWVLRRTEAPASGGT